MIKAQLKSLNKPSVKTIQSPDGDVIDCVPSHLQPAFDHPKLKGQKPLETPERPKGQEANGEPPEEVQTWRSSGEQCPEGTVAIRRTTEKDILRASLLGKFGRKPVAKVRRDASGSGHEHAVAYANGEYYGAKASLSVWSPRVQTPSEFSLSQIWVISGSFGGDLNTIEAGWQARIRNFTSNLRDQNLKFSTNKVMKLSQVSPQLYGDSHPRFFTYWTTDSYQETGCYNLLCSGFVQTTNKIAIGAAISPISQYGHGQFDITLLVWKDPKHGHWWLEFGSGLLVGYWPSSIFSHLGGHASMVQFGGEVVNTRISGFHSSTQMGSGRFAGEGFRRAAYFRNLEVVDWGNSLIPLSNLHILADHPTCYDIRGGVNAIWGNYFYYGGPGRNIKCP
ncbi:hypothetical protein AXF42_Ash003797 [Apostasia shenzhenica]|uniref:Neprosin PEP catalytic domain-containing protein n=1 Tax=Apostasia shenzhenica TaxID=1088818 RepID=A0A2I0AHZ1_9ASPA|nr:hypothetical protein AXF42_Ash003797 [Apostasia shenzhenica]